FESCVTSAIVKGTPSVNRLPLYRANMALPPGTAHAPTPWEFGTGIRPRLIEKFESTLLSVVHPREYKKDPILHTVQVISVVRPKCKVPATNVPMVLLPIIAFCGVPLSSVTVALFILKSVAPEEL